MDTFWIFLNYESSWYAFEELSMDFHTLHVIAPVKSLPGLRGSMPRRAEQAPNPSNTSTTGTGTSRREIGWGWFVALVADMNLRTKWLRSERSTMWICRLCPLRNQDSSRTDTVSIQVGCIVHFFLLSRFSRIRTPQVSYLRGRQASATLMSILTNKVL